MPIDMATTLCVRDRRTDTPASLVDIARVVGRWAELPEPEAAIESGSWTGVGQKGADVRVERLDPGAGSEWAWRLRLSHADLSDRTIAWEVEVEAIEPAEDSAGETFVSLALARTSTDDRVRHVRTDKPAPPRVIREIVEAEGLECVDGPIPLSSRVSTLGRLGVDGFVGETLLAEGRRLPVIGVSVHAASGMPILDQDRLARELAGMAHVWLVPPGVTWALEAALPERLGVYNGAVRVWWPGLRRDSDPYEHHLWLADGTNPIREIVDVVSRSALARFRPLAAVERLQRAERDRERQKAAEELRRLRDRLRAQPLEQGDSEGSAALDELERRLEYELAYQKELEREVRDLSERLRELDSDRDSDRARIRSLQAQVDGYRKATPDVVVGDEATRSFIAEVEAAFTKRYTESDRTEKPLGPIHLHADFLASVDAIQGIKRDKILEVCAEVACGRVHEVPTRNSHALREGEGPSSQDRFRARNGARAWRCYLQHNTPQARRLHWWAIPGGGVELAHVGLHDDLRCPE